MSEHASYDPAEALQLRARLPPSCESLRPPPLGRGARIAVVMLVTVAHLLFLRWMETRHSQTRAPFSEQRIEITFLPTTRPAPELPMRRRSSAPLRAQPVRSATESRRAPPVEPGSVLIPTPVFSTQQDATSAPLYRTDGSLILPQQVADELGAIDSDTRAFRFQHAGLAQAKGFAQRRAPLEYEATRFEAQWIDEKDVVTEALEKAVEKTTVTVRVPIPRSPGSKVVCKISLLAAGGACGIVNNGEGYVVALDDPKTLNEKEAQQCRIWWDEIVAAPSEAVLRAARERYESSCRKPLADADTLPPATPAGAVAEPPR